MFHKLPRPGSGAGSKDVGVDGRVRDSKRQGAWVRGLNDGLTQAIELILTPFVFGFLGFLVDRGLGTGRVFTFVLAGFGVVGAFVLAYYRYEARIAAEDEGKPWRRR